MLFAYQNPDVDVGLYALHLHILVAADPAPEQQLAGKHPAKLAAVVAAAEVCHTGQHSKAPCTVLSKRGVHDQLQAWHLDTLRALGTPSCAAAVAVETAAVGSVLKAQTDAVADGTCEAFETHHGLERGCY